MAAAGILTILAVALVAFLLAGVAQSVTGFGSALVAAPLLALVAGPSTTVVAVTLASLTLTGWAGVRERGHVDSRLAGRFVVAGLVGIPLGLVLLAHASDAALSVLMAATVLAALVLIASPIRLSGRPLTTWATGISSGALLTSTGMNGPPLVLGMEASGLPPRGFRATLQVVLCSQDVAAIAGFILIGSIDRTALLAAGVGVVASPLGWRLGDGVFHSIPADRFRQVLVAGLAVSALLLVISALS